MLGVTLNRNDVDGVWFVRVHVDREAEVGRQIAADLPPRLAGVVAAHHVPVLLHEQHARTRAVHRDAVNTVADLCSGVRDVLRMQAAVDRLPSFPGVVAAERARSRDRDENPPGMARIQNNRVQAHPAGPRLPFGPGSVAAQSGEFLPVLPAVGRAEQGGVFHAGVDRVRISQRRFQMPYALELPGLRRAVVPLVRGERLAGFRRRVVNKLVGLGLGHALWGGGRFARGCSGLVPGLATVIRALNDLPEPAARLRRIKPIRIRGSSLEMIHFPARKVGTADVPPLALSVRREDERALPCPNQYSYSAHSFTPLLLVSLDHFTQTGKKRDSSLRSE